MLQSTLLACVFVLVALFAREDRAIYRNITLVN